MALGVPQLLELGAMNDVAIVKEGWLHKRGQCPRGRVGAGVLELACRLSLGWHRDCLARALRLESPCRLPPCFPGRQRGHWGLSKAWLAGGPGHCPRAPEGRAELLGLAWCLPQAWAGKAVGGWVGGRDLHHPGALHGLCLCWSSQWPEPGTHPASPVRTEGSVPREGLGGA